MAITVKSATDETDARALPPGAEPEHLRLAALRQKLGAWMKPEDVFLTTGRVAIDGDSEGDWSVADVSDATGVVLIRRNIQTHEFKVRRDTADTVTVIRVAANATLREAREQLERRREMDGDDAFVDADGSRQFPVDDERFRPIVSALSKKDGQLIITSRADWG